MTYSAFLLAMRNSANTGGKHVRQGVSRAAQQSQRPVKNQSQRTVSSQANSTTAGDQKQVNHWSSFTDEGAYDFLAFDEFGEPCMFPTNWGS